MNLKITEPVQNIVFFNDYCAVEIFKVGAILHNVNFDLFPPSNGTRENSGNACPGTSILTYSHLKLTRIVMYLKAIDVDSCEPDERIAAGDSLTFLTLFKDSHLNCYVVMRSPGRVGKSPGCDRPCAVWSHPQHTAVLSCRSYIIPCCRPCSNYAPLTP